MTDIYKSTTPTSVTIYVEEPFGNSTEETLDEIVQITVCGDLIMFVESSKVSPCETTVYPVKYIQKFVFKN